MLSRRISLPLLALFALFFGGSSFVRAQRGLEQLKDEIAKNRKLIRDLITGDVEADANRPEHVNALNTQTEYLARRFIDPNEKSMAILVKDVDTDCRELIKYKAINQPTQKLYVHYFSLHAKSLLIGDGIRRAPQPVEAVNLTRALALLGELGQGELAEALADIIDADMKKDEIPEAERLKNPDKQPNDGVKYYALRGLQKLLEQPPQPPAMNPILTPAQEAKIVPVLVKLIKIGQVFKEGTEQQEIDGFRVRRREAVKALALVGRPALADKKDGAAMTLLRIVARDKAITPEPSMDERLEAAIGLARMQFEKEKDYNPDYALYHIGLFVDEFITFCNTDNATYQRPVKIYAARLIEALELIRTQLGEPAVKRTEAEKKYVEAVLQKIQTNLLKIEKVGRVDKNSYDLDTWLAGNKAPNTQLFKEVAETSVAPAAKKE